MVGTATLRVVAMVGVLATALAIAAGMHRVVPRLYPIEKTRLDEQTYRVVRAGVALGVVLGLLGAVLSVVDAIGTVQVIEEGRRGVVGGLAILIPAQVAAGMTYGGVAVLVGSALLAGAVEMRNIRE